MKLIEAQRPGPKNSRQPTIISWENEYGETKDIQYSIIRGAVAWPRESYPGIVLMAGREFESKKVVIFEEAEFNDLHKAADAFDRFWSYRPHLYYLIDIPENQGFRNYFWGQERLAGKLPFFPAPYPEAEGFGNNLIREFLSNGMLAVRRSGILVTQLQEARQDINPVELYGVRALRYLVSGINDRPDAFEVTDLNFNECAA